MHASSCWLSWRRTVGSIYQQSLPASTQTLCVPPPLPPFRFLAAASRPSSLPPTYLSSLCCPLFPILPPLPSPPLPMCLPMGQWLPPTCGPRPPPFLTPPPAPAADPSFLPSGPPPSLPVCSLILACPSYHRHPSVRACLSGAIPSLLLQAPPGAPLDEFWYTTRRH